MVFSQQEQYVNAKHPEFRDQAAKYLATTEKEPEIRDLFSTNSPVLPFRLSRVRPLQGAADEHGRSAVTKALERRRKMAAVTSHVTSELSQFSVRNLSIAVTNSNSTS